MRGSSRERDDEHYEAGVKDGQKKYPGGGCIKIGTNIVEKEQK